MDSTSNLSYNINLESESNTLNLILDNTEIINFQIFVPLERATINHPEWQIFNDLALTNKEWTIAAKYARNRNLIIFADKT